MLFCYWTWFRKRHEDVEVEGRVQGKYGRGGCTLFPKWEPVSLSHNFSKLTLNLAYLRHQIKPKFYNKDLVAALRGSCHPCMFKLCPLSLAPHLHSTPIKFTIDKYLNNFNRINAKFMLLDKNWEKLCSENLFLFCPHFTQVHFMSPQHNPKAPPMATSSSINS